MGKKIAVNLFYILVFMVSIVGIGTVLLRLSILAQPAPPADVFTQNFANHLSLTLLHILPGFIFIVLGLLQFIGKIRTKYPVFHRWSGRVCVAAGIVVGITALTLGFVFAYSGPLETIHIMLFSSLFLFCLGCAVHRIRNRKVAAHREWMIRAFAIGLASALARPIVLIITALTPLSFAEIFLISIWITFPLNLMIAELWIALTRARPAVKAVQPDAIIQAVISS